MRTFKLACSVAVVFVALVSARAAAQPVVRQGGGAVESSGDVGRLRPRLKIDLGGDAARDTKAPANSPRTVVVRVEPPQVDVDVPRFRTPRACGMPVIKRDPTIDPKMVAPLPSSDIGKFFLRILPVPPCAGQ